MRSKRLMTGSASSGIATSSPNEQTLTTGIPDIGRTISKGKQSSLGQCESWSSNPPLEEGG
jgi:hypothetical protein